jgi:hypothetical protein
VDPPLEPQDGRLPSLRPNPQDEPDIAKKFPLPYLPARMLDTFLAEMSGRWTTELFARNGCAR